MRRDLVAVRRAPGPWYVARPIYRAAALCLLFVLSAAVASAQPAGGKSGYAEIGALKMYYEVHGEGAPLLILHGGGSTVGTSFGAILPELAKAHMVLAPEQQGHGHTADLDRPLSYRQMADDTAALFKRLGLRQVDVLGFSNGGGVAIELAIRHPELVHRLVLGSVYYRRDDIRPELLRSFETANAQSMPEIYRKAYLAVAPNPDDLPRLTPKLMHNLLSFEGWSEAELGSIQAPTMILQGNYDVAPLEHIAAMARIIPGAQVVVLPGGHGAYLGEAMAAIPGSRLPTYATGIILEFLNGGAPR
ncbi:alpha/beta hydrolase [Sphingopyxis sp. CCNWLW253]|uniref:alpha/beta fold hydrolase n=1 Tax=unclassified Sphingopyxis TaxID=2614943 RepID=UPI003012AC21